MTKSVNQLINFFKPAGYMLTIKAIPAQREFEGTAFIAGKKKAEFVRLHAKDLEFDEVRVNGQIAKVVLLENDEIELRPEKAEPLDPDYAKELAERYGETCDVSIAMGFKGKIGDDSMHGLYPCKYELEGESRELLATQFESHHAREVFPCVDEPAAKAKFICRFDTTPELTVLSNMPIAETTRIEDKSGNQLQAVQFEMTPKMSTYLLAFVVGDLQRKTAMTKGGVEINVYATRAQSPESLDFALETAARSIDFYDDYFDTKYPLPKSDHVALPDFSSGAMENWGLITYRETCLLVNENTSLAAKEFIATVVAHELAHQWFGNLTTMQWWNDLWLNESFASLMEHYVIDKLYPEFNIWQSFETSEVISALRRDALAGVQPIQQDVNHPDEISTLFDSAIVYAKGERVLKMLQNFIGDDSFRAGLQQYFAKFAYQNTTADDLWGVLADASGYDVAGLMENWLTKPGYPVIDVKTNDNEVTLTQRRFLSNGETDETLWQVPLFASDENAPRVIDKREVTFTAKNVDDLQLNIGNFSHFITSYDTPTRENLNQKITTLPETDRLRLLNELSLLASAGVVSSTEVLKMLPHFEREDSNAVWDIVSLAFGDLRRIIEDDYRALNGLKELAGKLAEPQFRKLGANPIAGETESDVKLRPTILSQMLSAEDILDDTDDDIAPLNQRPVTQEIFDIYVKNKRNLSGISGDLRPSILSVAVRVAGQDDEFDYLLDLYKTISDAELKQDICAGLTSTRNPDQIDRLISLLNNQNIIRPQDISYWFSWLLGNRWARAKTWDWLRENWQWVEETFGGDKSFDIFPRVVGRVFRTDQGLKEYGDFFGPLKSEPALTRAIEIGLNDIQTRIDWIERDKAALVKLLTQ